MEKKENTKFWCGKNTFVREREGRLSVEQGVLQIIIYCPFSLLEGDGQRRAQENYKKVSFIRDKEQK